MPSARERLRDAALSGRRRSERVEVALGNDVVPLLVREMTARQREQFERLAQSGETQGIRKAVLVGVVTDIDGTPVFNADDDWFDDLPATAVERLFDALIRISGIDAQDEIAAAEKN